MECGVGREFSPHSVRHAATSSALAKGVEINVNQEPDRLVKDFEGFRNLLQ